MAFVNSDLRQVKGHGVFYYLNGVFCYPKSPHGVFTTLMVFFTTLVVFFITLVVYFATFHGVCRNPEGSHTSAGSRAQHGDSAQHQGSPQRQCEMLPENWQRTSRNKDRERVRKAYGVWLLAFTAKYKYFAF